MMTNATQKGRRDLSASDRPTQGPAATMRAVVQDAYGTSDALHLDQVDTPEISKDEVLVRVHAAGLDRGTWHLMTGRPYLLRSGLRTPRLRGTRSPDATSPARSSPWALRSRRFAEGDEVFGVAPGSFAEYAVAREDKLAHKPPTVSFEQAAVVPISGLTALQALTDAGRIQPGQQVLVIGASGGSAAMPCSWPRRSAPRSPVSCSTAKLDLVRSLGADHVIDYTCDDFADGGAALRPDPRHRGEPVALTAAPGADPVRDGCPRRRREGRQPDRRHGQAAAGAGGVAVRPSATDQSALQGARQRPRAPGRAAGSRPGHAEHRPDLSRSSGRQRP